MKLRLILFTLALLAFVSASSGGALYYSSLREYAFNEAERQTITRLEMIKSNILAYLSENVKPAATLAGIKALQRALIDTSPANLNAANRVLDHFKTTLNVNVCYLMDARGTTVASSNRNDPDSFVGENFKFRPYFQQAVAGHPATYLALGTTSIKRGAYHSHPIYGDADASPIGIVVIKVSIEQIEKALGPESEEIVMVTDPRGVIFISNRKDWLYHLIFRLSPDQLSQIEASLQFGKGPWRWVGLTEKGARYVLDRSGNEFFRDQVDLENFKGWKVLALRSRRDIVEKVSGPLIAITGPVVLSLCVLIGLFVFLLYRKASIELVQRKTFEQALKGAKEKLDRYSKDLERQVKTRTREITNILRYTPAVVYIKDHGGRYLLVNSRYEQLFHVRNDSVRGKTDFDILSPAAADQIWSNDLRVLTQKRPIQLEEHISHEDGTHTYLSVKFPIYDDSGSISGVCGILTDITQVKKAQDQLRRLSASIMANQEKERSAIARELHDELGQVLTALRIDAVWILDRLKQKDPKAALRALAMCELIDQTIQEVRGMAFRLRPGVLDDLGLVDALDWYTTDFERRTGVTCVFEHSAIPNVDDTLATAAYRIAQEALTNAARHAAASHIEVRVETRNGGLTLTVVDNGKGFNPGDLPESGGLGLAGMKERASLAGGILEIHSQPGQGTRIVCRMPVDAHSGGVH
jgi:PAS domain S-box-containing protein